MNKDNVYVLLHSPLVGPLTWSLVADQMRQQELDVLLPHLRDSTDSTEPFWKQHAASISTAFVQTPKHSPITLVAHSGAGPLLPVIRQSLVNPVNAYVFVDAGIPWNGATRLDLMKSEDPEWAAQFQEQLERGERFPAWSMDDLREAIPNESLRRQMVTELRPRGLDFFTESIPVFAGWPDAPCMYIQFSTFYEKSAAQARQAGWRTHKLEADHFHMLVDPATVTGLIVRSVQAVSS